MSTVAWIIVLVVAIPMIGLLVWLVIAASLVRVPSGSLGLLMVKGRATDTALLPGTHFLLALRRKMVVIYPAVELSYRAGSPVTADGEMLERSGPPLEVTLGDRTTATVPYTVRFRLVPDKLRQVHERFGPVGYFGSVRDASSAVVSAALRDPAIGIDDMFGAPLEICQKSVGAAVADTLDASGIELSAFLFGAAELGRTGEVIQATLRARHELEREQAEAPTRQARAANDADLQQNLTLSNEDAWRYRETDLWRELVQRTQVLQVGVPAVGPGVLGISTYDRVEAEQPAPNAQP
ncbi:MAG: SPFH domain-containing protein [Actinomycetota bacterium]|nr:SPFH domain-containing protein [Actinomycetota bacterium]